MKRPVPKLTDLDAYLESLLGRGLKAVGATEGSLMLLNARENVLEIVKRCGPPGDPRKQYRRFRVGDGVAGWVAKHCQPYFSPDVKKDRLFLPPLGSWKFRSLLVVPITGDGSAIGVISVDNPKPNRFQASEAQKLSRVAQGVGSAIQQLAVDTFVHHAKRLQQLESLHEVGQELSSLRFETPSELEAILREIAKDAVRVLRADLVTLYQYDPDKKMFHTPPTREGEFYHPEWMETAIGPGDAPTRIVAGKKSLYSKNAPGDPLMRARAALPASASARPCFVDREKVVSSAGILLMAGEEIVGVMFINYRSAQQFSADDRHVIEIFASYAALAIQGARRVHQIQVKRHAEGLALASQMFAHRLRNVLPIISSRLDMVLTSRTVTRQDGELCREALEKTRHAQRIVSGFEEFARAEVFERPDLLRADHLVSSLAEVVRKSLTRSSTRLDVTMPTNAPKVRVNLDRLKDDFVAFLRDSERHKKAGLRVSVGASVAKGAELEEWRLPNASGFLKLYYADNGPGVSAAMKEKIFEPFSTTTGGSGLGLALASHNASVHGGRIVESGVRGKGVRFEIFLPTLRERT